VRLATFLAPDGSGPHCGEVRGEEVVAFADGTTVTDRLRSGDRTPAGGAVHRLDAVSLLAPHTPRAIFGIGLNYRAHAAEQGLEPPAAPIVFMKLPSSAAPPGGPVRIPAVVKRLDYEGELAVVMGRLARNVLAEEAGKYILGYTCGNDVTLRDLQKRDGQWARAKGFDGSCPLGPWIETVLDPGDVRIETRVNGETKQFASTSALVFGVATLIAFITTFMTLLPGDVIMTGTPEGVGKLEPGDLVEVEIEGIGVLSNTVEAR
jgi:2-keto-4-pentenoate hydratase/2-oxohepta-3-ene-1,7-dioic acid hydratase in catechol pathway